jgi:DNA-directed RNA polymerase I and III subunit RPAC1
MMAEVETVAADLVGIKANTSIIADEILAHRIGLVPFNVDPERLPSKETRLNFDIYKECVEEGVDDRVLSKDLMWASEDGVTHPELLKLEPRPAPLHDDILLARLIPGQKIFLRAQLRVGVGKEHAKFSPVATASYRLMPIISINEQLAPKLAKDIKANCPMDVFDIEDGDRLVVADAKRCTMCRECIRPDGWDQVITLERDPNHFIFSIEGVGMIEPEEIFVRACKKLAQKCKDLGKDVADMLREEQQLAA